MEQAKPSPRSAIKLKVCGMTQADNMLELAAMQPEYMGLIFYEKSSRFFHAQIPQLPDGLKKVGVFVDSEVSYIMEKVDQYDLNVIQLHGKESPDYCVELKAKLSEGIEIIKVFSVKEQFDFSLLSAYEDVCDYFLFDTKGKLPGGNGEHFDWSLLEQYPSRKPFFLSGGIGIDSIPQLKEFLKRPIAQFCHAIDVNSRFELQPGLKKIDKLKEFKKMFENEN